MTLLAKMDRLVYATRLDRLIFMKIKPRTFRWSPLLVIAALVTGYALMAKAAGIPNRSFFVGCLLFYGAFSAAAFLRVFGPPFTATATRPLDEREAMIQARAYSIAGILLAGLAMLGCFYMASEGLIGLWYPSRPFDWFNLGFAFQASSVLLPTWIASWLEPRPAADQED